MNESTKTKLISRFKYWLNSNVIQSWLDRGLQAKLGLMVLVGMTGIILIFAFLGINSARQSTSQALNERVLLARVSADKLDFVFQNLIQTLIVMASQPGLQHLEGSPAEVTTILQGSPVFGQTVLLVDAGTGSLIASTRNPGTILWNTIPAFQNAVKGNRNETHISLLSNNKPLAFITIPVFGSAGPPHAVLAVLVDFSDPAITPYSGVFELGKTGTLEVVDSSGLILMSTQRDRVMTTYNDQTVIDQLFEEGASGVETCLGCSEEMQGGSRDEVIAFAPLKQVTWGVIVRQKAEEVFTPVRRLTFQTVVLGLFTILGALFLVWLTTNSVINPVQSLTSAVHRIGSGDLSSAIEPFGRSIGPQRKRRDEIGQLAESFDEMRSRLKSSIDEIRQLNQELDKRVHDRTQAAMAAQLEAQEARDDLRAIIDALSDILVVIGVDDHRVVQMNRASLEFCSQPGIILGEKCYEIFPSDQSHCSIHELCPISAVVTTGESVKTTLRMQSQPDQEARYFDVVASPMFDARGKITRIVELRRDVTEETRIREELVRRNEQLAIINSVANTVNQSLKLEEILQKSLEEILRLTSIDAGAIFMKVDPTNDLKMMAYKGLSKNAARLASQVGLLDGSCGGVLETGQITIVPDLTRFRGHRARSLQQEKLSTLVHIPLTVKGCTLGSMCVGTQQQRQFDDEDQQLLSALGSQIAVAIENAQLYAEVQHKEHVRGELFIKAINAQEEERKRIARELHDETSQSIAAILFAIEEALEMDSLETVRDRLNKMLGLTKHVLEDVHKIIFDLRPSMLDHLGLVPALRWLAESRLTKKGVRVIVNEASPPKRLSPEVETAIFRVVQEAITNIGRHAAARNVCILFNMTDAGVSVDVEDDGVGFDLESLNTEADNMRGLGLLSMRERLELLGGELTIRTFPGQGTRLSIQMGL